MTHIVTAGEGRLNCRCTYGWLVKYEWPARFVFWPELPSFSAFGKVDERDVKHLFEEIH